jgi:hypothetical protein
MITGLDQLVALERQLDGTKDAATRAARKAAPKLLALVKRQWAQGRAPNGSKWPLTKDGKIPLVALTSQATAQASGSSVVITLPEEAQYHQEGDPPRLPRRQLVPDPGEPLPASWEQVLETVWKDEVG